jgi:hypothetical protein
LAKSDTGLIRVKRREQLLKPTGNYTYGSGFILDLVESAQLLLLSAAKERGSKDGENYLTVHGTAAILVTVTAFESFLNDTLHSCLRTLNTNVAKFEELATNDSLMNKFADIPALATGGPPLSNPDVSLVQHVRNEIVHYYPRPVGNTHVPEWLQSLAERGLFYTIGKPPHDIGWQQKLQSFGLARWVAATSAQAAQQFAGPFALKLRDTPSLALIADGVQIIANYFRGLGI